MRAGKDVTILCYSRMRYVVMQAVQQLEKQGYDPEVRGFLPARLLGLVSPASRLVVGARGPGRVVHVVLRGLHTW